MKWQTFLKKHKGQSLTLKKLSEMYHQQNDVAGKKKKAGKKNQGYKKRRHCAEDVRDLDSFVSVPLVADLREDPKILRNEVERSQDDRDARRDCADRYRKLQKNGDKRITELHIKDCISDFTPEAIDLVRKSGYKLDYPDEYEKEIRYRRAANARRCDYAAFMKKFANKGLSRKELECAYRDACVFPKKWKNQIRRELSEEKEELRRELSQEPEPSKDVLPSVFGESLDSLVKTPRFPEPSKGVLPSVFGSPDIPRRILSRQQQLLYSSESPQIIPADPVAPAIPDNECDTCIKKEPEPNAAQSIANAISGAVAGVGGYLATWLPVGGQDAQDKEKEFQKLMDAELADDEGSEENVSTKGSIIAEVREGDKSTPEIVKAAKKKRSDGIREGNIMSQRLRKRK